MTTLDLNIQFRKETGMSCINSQGEPDIDYVKWLEKKMITVHHNACVETIEACKKQWMIDMKEWIYPPHPPINIIKKQ